MLQEEFLHHIWKFGLFNQRELTTIDGRSVRIVHPGQHNHHAGPDFFNAQIVIADTTWAGNVEIHVNEKEWYRHGHQNDAAYNNVVLHVVFHAGGESVNALGNDIPVVELAGRVSRRQIDLYQSFLTSKQYIACENSLATVDEIIKFSWLDRLLVERLERKSEAVLYRLDRNTGNWQQTLFEQLAVNFGFKVNAQPMEMLARSIPVKLIAKYQHSLVLIESLLFGQAGFLEDQFQETYPIQLQNEYSFLQKKHRLIAMNNVSWKFGRMRPANFPTIRLAQFASLLHQSEGLFSAIIDQPNVKLLAKMFEVSASTYWNDHHHFGKTGVRVNEKRLGKSSGESILINTVLPFLFAYSKRNDSQEHLDKALELAEIIPAEENSVIRKMGTLGFIADNAARTQSLLELKSQYCDSKKCLNCAIGNQLLKTVTNDFSN